MRPLNYAILKYFTTVEEACPIQVYEALKDEYSHHRMCTAKKVKEAVMTAEKNGLLEESRYEVDADGKVILYYQAVGEGRDAINKYIKD